MNVSSLINFGLQDKGILKSALALHRRKKNKQKDKIGFDVISNLDDEGDLAELAIFS